MAEKLGIGGALLVAPTTITSQEGLFAISKQSRTPHRLPIILYNFLDAAV